MLSCCLAGSAEAGQEVREKAPNSCRQMGAAENTLWSSYQNHSYDGGGCEFGHFEAVREACQDFHQDASGVWSFDHFPRTQVRAGGKVAANWGPHPEDEARGGLTSKFAPQRPSGVQGGVRVAEGISDDRD